MERLTIPPEISEQIQRHARLEYPREACGILSGTGGRVRRIHVLKNADASRATYHIEPAEQLAVMRSIERDGAELLAIYHSHPDSPPVPSPTDIERAFFPGTRLPSFPGVAYVIVSLAGGSPETRAYLIESEDVREIGISAA